jgi:hypothetical protein
LTVKARIQDLEDGVSDLHETADKTQGWEATEALNKKAKEALIAVSTKYSEWNKWESSLNSSCSIK